MQKLKTMLVLLLLLGLAALFSTAVLAANTTSGTCGENLTWVLEDGVLTISGTGEMEDNNAPWHSLAEEITTVVIEDGVTSIGDYAFSWCTSLTDVEIGNSVVSIGEKAFNKCVSLTSVAIPDNVVSIGDAAFAYCIEMTSMTIGSGVTDIGSFPFLPNCSALTEIQISPGNPYYCSEDGVMFSKDKSTLVRYPSGREAASYVIPDGVTCIGAWSFYYYCYNLTSVTIPDSVVEIGNGAFVGCEHLTEIMMGDGVTRIGYSAFDGTAYYNDNTNWENGSLYIGNWLIKVSADVSGSYEIPAGITGVATYAFSENLDEILVSEDNPAYCSADGVLFCKDKSELVCYPARREETDDVYAIPDTVTGIWDYAFASCRTLQNVEIPDSVTRIGEYVFCSSNLTHITIPGNVISISDCAFEDCTSLTDVAIEDGVTSVDYGAFMYCSNLTYITISDSVASIGDYAFYGCSNLTSVMIPDSVTSIGNGVFSECSSLTNVTISSSATSIGSYAFYYCSSLTSVTIPNSTVYIDSSAFGWCSSLTDIYYGGSEDEWNAIEIGDGNTNLTSATIHYTTTDAEDEPTSPATPGDLNGDGEVNASDLTVLARHVGKVETM
ncbi:MAG: leucine-rich repeat protein, partial [Oscillospiraceae bacterium]|nr:leucine-rich repeat protein [Oscillospiraceae bacterium]